MAPGAEDEKNVDGPTLSTEQSFADDEAVMDDDPFAQVGNTDADEPITKEDGTEDGKATHGQGDLQEKRAAVVELPEHEGPDPFASIGAAAEEEDNTADVDADETLAPTGRGETEDSELSAVSKTEAPPRLSSPPIPQAAPIAQDEEEASQDYLAQLGANPPDTDHDAEGTLAAMKPEVDDEEDIFSKLADEKPTMPDPEIDSTLPAHALDDHDDDVFAQLTEQHSDQIIEPDARPFESEELEGDPFSQLGNDGAEAEALGPKDEPAPVSLDFTDDREDPFSNLGDGQEPDFPAGQTQEERDYSALLDEFSGLEDEPLPDTAARRASSSELFGDEPQSSTFDDFSASTGQGFLQTASGSTTPPDLSVENSFQDDSHGGYDASGGDYSTRSGGSWLADTAMDDEPFDVQADPVNETLAEPPVSTDSSSPLQFEVPYGWYEGDTFHYYTEEEREQVRLTMLGQSEWPSSDTQEPVQGTWFRSRFLDMLTRELIIRSTGSEDGFASSTVRVFRECCSAYT